MPTRSSLRFLQVTPPPPIGAMVECVWMAWDPRRHPDRPEDHVVPDGCPEIIVHLGPPFSRHDGSGWRRQPRAFLAGVLSRPWRLRAGATVRTLGIRFRPGGATARLALRMDEAADREVPLDEAIGRAERRRLLTGLGATRTPSATLAAAVRWLRCSPALEPAGRTSVTVPAVREVLAHRGRERVDALASRLGVPRRRLERLFARDVGLRPKLFARIVRLQAALAALSPGQRPEAVDWALAAGYFDQAHMARDFRVVAGRRATRARELDGEMSRHFTAPPRLAAYLAGE